MFFEFLKITCSRLVFPLSDTKSSVFKIVSLMVSNFRQGQPAKTSHQTDKLQLNPLT